MGELVDTSALRVCADPADLPFSNEQRAGFENKIAELLAAKLGVPVDYTWWPQSMGFVRNTLRANRCDLIIGVVATDELVQSSNPYYRSSYVLAVRTQELDRFGDIDGPLMVAARIGVVAGTPPTDLLVRKGKYVKRGQKIALVCSTGASTGAHLHFEVKSTEKHVNPGLAMKKTERVAVKRRDA